MMKKVLILLLAFAYISTSAGIIIHTHYCMGEPIAWELGQKKSKSCSKCGMEKSDGSNGSCCKDEYKVLKSNIDQKNVENGFHFNQFQGKLLPFIVTAISINTIDILAEKRVTSSPPFPIKCIAVYISNCVFLI